jgi:acyl-CoA thioester hydrolase
VAPARLDDSLIVETALSVQRGASVELRQRVLREGILLVAANVQLACVQESTGKPGRIPSEWRAALERLALAGEEK